MAAGEHFESRADVWQHNHDCPYHGMTVSINYSAPQGSVKVAPTCCITGQPLTFMTKNSFLSDTTGFTMGVRI